MKSHRLQSLRAKGFDESYNVPFTRQYVVKCSCCEAVVINGYPCHETGCPNMKYECEGCGDLIDYPGYCQDCQ